MSSLLQQRWELAQSIERDQQELARAVEELRLVTRARLDLGHRVAAHPGLWLGGSFLLGWSLAQALAPSGRAR